MKNIKIRYYRTRNTTLQLCDSDVHLQFVDLCPPLLCVFVVFLYLELIPTNIRGRNLNGERERNTWNEK